MQTKEINAKNIWQANCIFSELAQWDLSYLQISANENDIALRTTTAKFERLELRQERKNKVQAKREKLNFFLIGKKNWIIILPYLFNFQSTFNQLSINSLLYSKFQLSFNFQTTFNQLSINFQSTLYYDVNFNSFSTYFQLNFQSTSIGQRLKWQNIEKNQLFCLHPDRFISWDQCEKNGQTCYLPVFAWRSRSLAQQKGEATIKYKWTKADDICLCLHYLQPVMKVMKNMRSLKGIKLIIKMFYKTGKRRRGNTKTLDVCDPFVNHPDRFYWKT